MKVTTRLTHIYCIVNNNILDNKVFPLLVVTNIRISISSHLIYVKVFIIISIWSI